MIQCTNRKANALQSILGIFLQSTHTPQKVIDTLACISVSVSTETVNVAIRSLSMESQQNLCELSQSLLASYAYDNFDVDLKSQVSTAEKSTTSLKHLTSGLMFPLDHGITTNDLKCSEQLWKCSMLNEKADLSDLPLKRSWCSLLGIHPEQPPSPPGQPLSSPHLSCHDHFNSWVFLTDLCAHGPEYFQHFKSEISEPEVIEQIPLVKTPITAVHAMDINNSTVSGNIWAVIDLLSQGGIYHPEDAETMGTPDISPYVVLIHGDLGTGERLQAAQLHRSSEATSWNHFQYLVFIPGLFHLKMACADAIWRCFLQPHSARDDETSLMRDVLQLRPKETRIYSSKPGFRRMHQLIGHAETVRQLDCWRTYIAKKNSTWTSLETFATSKPGFDELKQMADEIAINYVASEQLYLMRNFREPKEHDMQFENALLLNKYFLLYEELSFAMNRGDIGQVETSIVSWIPILKAIGKHKYATHISTFLLNIHFVYPPGLK